jgi:hypothetical protein
MRHREHRAPASLGAEREQREQTDATEHRIRTTAVAAEVENITRRKIGLRDRFDEVAP